MKNRTFSLIAALAVAAGCAGSDSKAAPGSEGQGGSASTTGGGGTTGNPGTPHCTDDLSFFETQVWKPILSKQCIVCHQAGGLAATSRLKLVPSSTEGYLEANYASAATLAAEQSGGIATLLARPAGQHAQGHPGGTLTPPGSEGYKALASFAERVTHPDCATAGTGGTNGGGACTATTPGRRRLRRLTRNEYDRTVRDLFQLPATYTAGLTSDNVVNGFDNNADALLVSPLLADQVRKSAEQLALLAKLPTCTGDATACASDLLAGLGRRVFRRPLTDDERARYLALHAAIAKEDGADVASQTVLTAMLQSPHFLYRSELGAASSDGLYRLTPYELATELSYLVWGSMPDDALLDAAAQGKLASADGVAAQLARLLDDPRSAVTLDAFVGQWLDLDRLPSVAKDAAAYPEFTPALRAGLREETRRFFDHVVRSGEGTLHELLSARYTFAAGDVAALYGVSSQDWAKLPVDGRAGILTQGSVLAVHGHPNSSSPIHRGKLVRERLLCQPLQPPPPTLNVQPPPVDPTLSTRERFAAHATQEPCISCHKLIDPIGFTFERFDGIGRMRDTEAGKPINDQGAIVDSVSTDGDVTGAVALADKLADSAEVRACFATQWLRFAYGIDESMEASCLADQVSSSYAQGDGSVRALLSALVSSAHFVARQADPDVSEGTGGTGGTSGSAGSPAAAGTDAGGTDAGQGGTGTTEPPASAVKADVHVDSTWPTGACSTVTVTNTGSQKVDWKVSLDVGGTLSDVWNATPTPDGDKVSFVGVAWNASLTPGSTASFGFCVTK